MTTPPPLSGLPDLGFLGAVPYHLSYATADLGRAMTVFGALFGLTWTSIEDDVAPGLGPADTTGWACRRTVSVGGPLPVELQEGSPGSVWHTEAEAELHHLAYWVADLPGAVARLQAEGWAVELTLPGPGGDPTEFAYVTRPGWPRLELVAAHRAAAFLERTGQPPRPEVSR